jgi:MFS family permease
MPEGGKGLLRLLAHSSYRRLWLAGLLSSAGSQMSRIGLLLYLYKSTHSVPGLALLVLLETLPGALLAPMAGVVVDRAKKRTVMIASDLARCAFLLAIFAWPSVAVLYLMAALQSIATVFFQPAAASSLPLILEPEDMPRANGLDQATANLVMILGPVAGAELFLAYGLEAILLVDAASFLLSAALVTGVSVRPVAPPEKTEESGMLSELRTGWAYLREHRLVLHLAALFFVSLLCVGLWIPLAPFFVDEFLKGSEHVLGYQMAAFGAGGVLGGLLAPRLVAWLGKGKTLVLAWMAEAVAMITYSQVPQVGGSLAIIFVWGIVVTMVVVPFYSILQNIVDERFLGRVFSLLKQGENLALVLAMGAAMGLRGVLGTHLIFALAGITYFAIAAASSLTPGGRFLRAFR